MGGGGVLLAIILKVRAANAVYTSVILICTKTNLWCLQCGLCCK